MNLIKKDTEFFMKIFFGRADRAKNFVLYKTVVPNSKNQRKVERDK